MAPADAHLWETSTCMIASQRSWGNLCQSISRQAICQKDNIALPTPPTAFSWRRPFRRESKSKSSFARARTPLSPPGFWAHQLHGGRCSGEEHQ